LVVVKCYSGARYNFKIMANISKKFLKQASIIMIISGIICFIAVNGYFLWQNKNFLEKELNLINDRYAITIKLLNNRITDLKQRNDDLNATINEIEKDLAITQEERDAFENKYRSEKKRLDELNSQVEDIQDAADTLQKLETIDNELLMKYSKVYFLNENYVPRSLSPIDSEYTYNPKEKYLFIQRFCPF